MPNDDYDIDKKVEISADTDVTYHVMPRSIKEIYKADVTVHQGVASGFMNKPESEEE